MAEKKIYLTKEGQQKMEARLIQLKTVARPEVILKIKEARAQGDLSENAEYDAAKEEQGKIEGEITDLEETLRHAEIIDESTMTNDKVSFGSKVTVYDPSFDEESVYTIVGSQEADPMEDRISNESPIGAALMGHSVGETVTVQTPAGPLDLEIREIIR